MNEKQLDQVAAIQQHKLNLFFEDQPVRMLIDDDAAPWWVAKDVCDVLELNNVGEALKPLDEDELTSEILMSGGQRREMKLINESGLYTLIFRSSKPHAKRFRRWVTHEVLPTIRRTGSYSLLAADTSIDLESIRQVIRQELATYTPPRRGSKPVSDEEIALFKADIQAGLGTSATAKKHGRGKSTIKDHTRAERRARLLLLPGVEA